MALKTVVRNNSRQPDSLKLARSQSELGLRIGQREKGISPKVDLRKTFKPSQATIHDNATATPVAQHQSEQTRQMEKLIEENTKLKADLLIM